MFKHFNLVFSYFYSHVVSPWYIIHWVGSDLFLSQILLIICLLDYFTMICLFLWLCLYLWLCLSLFFVYISDCVRISVFCLYLRLCSYLCVLFISPIVFVSLFFVYIHDCVRISVFCLYLRLCSYLCVLFISPIVFVSLCFGYILRLVSKWDFAYISGFLFISLICSISLD